MKIKRRIIVSLFVLLSAVIITPNLSYGKTLSAKAENKLGYDYYYGKGVPQDYSAAAYWFEKAAAQGDAAAENNLGLAYYYGHGVPKDYSLAVYWLQKAAAQGNATAKRNLSIIQH